MLKSNLLQRRATAGTPQISMDFQLPGTPFSPFIRRPPGTPAIPPSPKTLISDRSFAFPGSSAQVRPSPLASRPGKSARSSVGVLKADLDMFKFFENRISWKSEPIELCDKQNHVFTFCLRAIPVYADYSGLTEPKHIDLVLERARSKSVPFQPSCTVELKLLVFKPIQSAETYQSLDRMPIEYTFADELDGEDMNKLVLRRCIKPNPMIYFSDFLSKQRWLRFQLNIALDFF